MTQNRFLATMGMINWVIVTDHDKVKVIDDDEEDENSGSGDVGETMPPLNIFSGFGCTDV